MTHQSDDPLAEANLLRCTIHHSSGSESMHLVVYDTGLLLEQERQNLLRMQTARDLMEQISVHTRPKERSIFHHATILDRDALSQALRLETRDRQRTMIELDDQIRYHANTSLREYRQQREHRRGVCSPPVYSWLIPELCRCRLLNRSSGAPLLVHGTTINPSSDLLE